MRDILERVARRIYTLVRRGKIGLVDDSGVIQTAQVDFGPIGPDGKSLGIRDKTKIVVHYGFSANPWPGADAVAIAVGGDFGDVVVIGVNHQRDRPTGLASGESMQWDHWANKVHLAEAGITVTDRWGNTVTLAQSQVTVQHQTKVVIHAPAIELTSGSGAPAAIARVGDNVDLTTGRIISGSAVATSG